MRHVLSVGVLSATATPVGHKEFRFHDGQTIRASLIGDNVYNLMMGTLSHQLTGKVTFVDEQNNLHGYYQLGAYSMKTQDYMYGEIFRGDERVCEIEGNYMGFFDIDKVRYWDIREKNKTFLGVRNDDPNS